MIIMTDGAPNIIGPIGGLLGLGVMAYAAKGVIDVMKQQSMEDKAKKRQARYREKYEYTPRPEADRIQRGLNKMLGR